MRIVYTISFLLCVLLNYSRSQDRTNRQDIDKRSGYQLTEVIVTADKTETDMQKTPLSLSVLNAKETNDTRIWDVKDLSAVVPNLYAAHPGDLRSVVSIRGITISSCEPAVAVYVDGVNQFSLDTYISQLNDIERIEVLRGPQGTLYGRNASGGVINIITKQPDNHIRGFAGIDYGNFGLQRYTAGIGIPVITDKLFVGATGLFQLKDGFSLNEFTGLSYDDLNMSQGNYFLKYQTNKRLTFSINVKHQLQLNSGAFPLVSDMQEAFENPYTLDQNRLSKMRDNTFNVSLTGIYKHDHYTLTSQTSYQDNYRFYEDPIDGDFSSHDIIAVINNYGKKWNRSKVFMQEIRFSSPLHSVSRLRWNMGIYGFKQGNPVKQGTYYGDDAEMYGSPVTNFTDITINNLTGYGFAGFGQIDYQLSSSLSLIGGLRYDYEQKEQQIEGIFLPDGGEAVITRTDTSASKAYRNFSPKIALNYSLSKEHNFYGAYSKGFRAGGISKLSSDPSAPPLVPYDSEYSNNFEIGSKNMFAGKRLRLNAALFYTRIKNGQIPVLIMPEALTVIRNAAKLESKGAELELYGVPIEGIEFTYTFGYTNASYRELIIADDGENKDLSGNKQLFTPQTTSFLSLQYTRSLSSNTNSKLFARFEHRNIGKQYFNLANTIQQDAYNLLNFRLGFQYKRMEAALWVSNLMNKTYIDYAYDFGAVHLAEPRMYGLTIKTSFVGNSGKKGS